MAIAIGISPIGIFAVENGKVVDKIIFERKAEEIASIMLDFSEGRKPAKLEEFSKKFKGAILDYPNQAYEFLKDNSRKLTKEYFKSDEEYNNFLNALAIEIVKKKISTSEKRDKLLVNAVNALDSLDKIINTMAERIEEWYKLHYPELEIADHRKFCKAVSEYGKRENFKDFEFSMGMDLKDSDIKIIKEYSDSILKLFDLRDKLEEYLKQAVPEEMPNTNALLGPVLTARLVAQAGSMEKLSKLSSSAIQLIGAEKALFRYMKEKRMGGREGKEARPPRFGILYTHPDIIGTKRELQGKIARLLASKLTLAVRADYYSKQNISEKLLADYNEKIKKIREGEE